MKHLIAVFIVICAIAAFGQNTTKHAPNTQLRALAFDLGHKLGYADDEIAFSCKINLVNTVDIYAHDLLNRDQANIEELQQSNRDLGKTVNADQQQIVLLELANESLSSGLQELRSETLPLYQPLPEPQQVNVHVTQEPAAVAPSFPTQVNLPVFCQSQTYGVTTSSNCF